MKNLNGELLRSDFFLPEDAAAQINSSNLPERVIQFGEGNFLRAFVDWMIHQLNKQGKFNGRVVVVQPIAQGLAGKLNEQDGLYTLLLRGLQDGNPVEQKEIISSISRGINPYTDWDAYLKCAENPAIEFVISNTTEAGIAYDENDRLDHEPPSSFPGKLAVYLYHRFQHFHGAPDKGMVIIPCELIDRNGDNLKEVILKLCDAWSLPQEFKSWVCNHNYFLNSLVDRVVTGYPKDEVADLETKLGYSDQLINTGELFHLWVIEGPQELAKRLPFAEVGLNAIWTEDMAPYRTRKVRILNGAHTASVPAAFLYGLEEVGEMMDHEVLGKYVRQIVSDEIIPSIHLDKKMLTEFADSVIERFQNPYIRHYLISILLNSSSKFKARVLPSILEYQHLHGVLPEKLTFSLAALIAVYKDGKVVGNGMQAKREKGEFVMKDDVPVLEFFADTWKAFDGSQESITAVVKTVLENAAIWGQDLNQVNSLTEKTADYLYQIVNDGMQVTVAQLIRR
jgi:tagaturonate reductase